MFIALRDRLGLKVRVYKARETVGGTWCWNRYPGARCDSDSYIYCFTWDKQLLHEWEWSERRYPEQPEILRYLEHVAERHDLKRDIRFNTRVTGAEFDERDRHLTSIASITLVIAGFLVLASLVQPAAERLHLPYTVLLAVVGIAIGGFSSVLFYTPLTNFF
jgi:cation diffusion facilitator CzcD-associated flavoprotein CzcO